MSRSFASLPLIASVLLSTVMVNAGSLSSAFSSALSTAASFSSSSLFFDRSSIDNSAANPQCCFYGGQGAGLAYGIGTFPIPSDTASYSVEVPIAIGSGGDVPGVAPWLAVLIAPQSSPQDSALGWYITQNKTAQTMYIFTNVNNQPSCIVTSVALPETFVPGFSLCAGYASSAFPFYNRSYTISSLGVNVFYQLGQNDDIQATLRVSDDESCSPVGFSTPQNPFGTGSITVNFEGGSSQSPAWKIPTFCGK